MKSPPLFPLVLLLAGALSLLLAREPLRPCLDTAAKVLTLDEAVEIALHQNPLILNAKQEIERTRGQVIEVRARALPQVTLTAIYQQQAPDLVRGQSGQAGGQRLATAPTPTPAPAVTPSVPGAPTPTPTPTPKASPTPMAFIQDKTWQVNIQVNQLLYSGGQVEAALRMAKLTQDSTYFKLRDSINTVIANVRTQFYQVLTTRALIGVQEESVNLLSSQLSDQEARYKAGTVPRFNVLQAQVALANALPN